MLFGVSDSVVKQLNKVFSTVDEIEEAVVFGSRAKGSYKEGSDIDVAIKGPGLNFPVLRKVEVKVDELELPYVIDLVIYHQISEPLLIEHIDRVGICIYRKGKCKC